MLFSGQEILRGVNLSISTQSTRISVCYFKITASAEKLFHSTAKDNEIVVPEGKTLLFTSSLVVKLFAWNINKPQENMKERIVVITILRPLATHAHKGDRYFKRTRIFNIAWRQIVYSLKVSDIKAVVNINRNSERNGLQMPKLLADIGSVCELGSWPMNGTLTLVFK